MWLPTMVVARFDINTVGFDCQTATSEVVLLPWKGKTEQAWKKLKRAKTGIQDKKKEQHLGFQRGLPPQY